MVVMAPRVESLSQAAFVRRIGVCPRGAQVRVTVGFRLKPLSSRKTRVAPCSTFFFQLRERVLDPSLDGLFIPLQSPLFRFLRTEAELMKDFSDVIGVIPHVKVRSDDRPHAGGRPARVGIACRQWSCTQQLSQSSALFWTQALGRPRSLGSLEAPILTETLLPGSDGTFGNAERFRDFLGTDLACG